MGVNGSVVVDASLAVKWLVEEDDSDKAHAALQSWVAQDITRIAPPRISCPSRSPTLFTGACCVAN